MCLSTPFLPPTPFPNCLCCCYSQTLHTTAREYILAEAFFSFKQASTFEKKSWKLCYNFTFMTICSLALLSTVFSFWNEDFTHDHIESHTFDTRNRMMCTNVYKIHIVTSWACLFDSRTFMWKREKKQEVTDIQSLIMKYCVIIKAVVKLATEATLFMHFWCLLYSVHAFLVSSVTCETLTDAIT